MWLCDHWASKGNREGKERTHGDQQVKEQTPQRWVSGQTVAGSKGNHLLPLDHSIDAAFQIIKIAAFSLSATHQHVSESSCQRLYADGTLKEVTTSWLNGLRNNRKKQGEYLFPRSKMGEPDRFHLMDHVLLWWAIRSAEELELPLSELDFDYGEQSRKDRSIPEKFQLYILKRFTTENTEFKKRMIATSRSSLDSQFFLGVEETLLFHAAEINLFSKSRTGKKITEWERTENCQRHYKENDGVDWDHPLQFALAIILASQDKSINSLEPADMYAGAKSVLFETSSPNGLLAGKLNSDQSPGIFDEKETHQSYWSTTFEVPFILWKYQRPQGEPASTGSQELTTKPSRQPSSMLRERTTSKILQKISQISDRLDRLGLPPEITAIKEDVIEQRIPFGNSIDQSNIVERSDDWLYDEPAFFTFHQDPGGIALQTFWSEYKCTHWRTVVCEAITFLGVDASSATRRYNSQEVRGIILDVRTMHYLKDSKSDSTGNDDPPTMKISADREAGNAPDMKDQKDPRERYRRTRINNDTDLCNYLKEKRTRANAKKRFFQFFRTKKTTALICYLSSSEGKNLSTFFDRHAHYERYFSDHATAALNKWVTELHLPFYRLFEPGDSLPKPDEPTSSDSRSNDLPSAYEIKLPLPGNGQKKNMWVRRAMISFRFDGDIFDRYWTGHFLEYDQTGTISTKIDELDVCRDVGDDHWKQRKVLELVLFDRILARMLEATRNVLRNARTCVWRLINADNPAVSTEQNISPLEDALNLLAAENNDAFLSISVLCHRIQHLLQAVQDNLRNNLLTIQLWSDRERARGADRPRWTRKDEQRYRSTLSKWQASIELHTLELRRCEANIESYNALLTKKLEDIRSELELRGADDIRLFTYVTAVFLPVGFATGLFSMSEPPSGVTLYGMMVTATVALLLTLIALVNAKFLRANLLGPVIHTCGNAFHKLVRYMRRLAETPARLNLSGLSGGNQASDVEKQGPGRRPANRQVLD